MTAYRTALMPDMKQRLSVTSGRPARDSCEDVNFMTSPEKGEKKKKRKHSLLSVLPHGNIETPLKAKLTSHKYFHGW